VSISGKDKKMKKFFGLSVQHISQGSGQALVEYVFLVAMIGVLVIFSLIMVGGSVEGGFLKICAGLGNETCRAAEIQITPVVTSTVVPSITPGPSQVAQVPTATPIPVDPDPTRAPASTLSSPNGGAGEKEKEKENEDEDEDEDDIEMRIKVVINKKSGENNNRGGIRVVLYDVNGNFIMDGFTDDKGNILFSVASGDYYIATLYNNIWEKVGPISVKNSKENVIHR
jgi:Flp pilus assembly pilin Flp